MSKNRKTINKETQDAIKKLLSSNISFREKSPCTPPFELDDNFSRILQKKHKEQLEASRLGLYNSNVSRLDSKIEANHTEKKSESLGSLPIKKSVPTELENSMMFGKANKSWNDFSEGEDSFLALERQCNMEDKHERLMNANDTLLFDVEPPSELWNQTINQTLATTNLDESKDGGNAIEISPAIAIIQHPSTIIEETSSQIDSMSKSANSTLSAKSSFNETGSTMDTVKELSSKSCDTSKESNISQETAIVSPLRMRKPQVKKVERQRRGTFAFKRANYTFFPDENLMPIDESIGCDSTSSLSNVSQSNASEKGPIERSILEEEVKTPTHKLIDIDVNSAKTKDRDEEDEDKFNNTLERVDYLLEKGKQMLEETPVAKRTSLHTSLLETPLFSCKRKRLISEMASEMLPLPKRGPLIDFSTPEVTNQSRFSKFERK